MICGVIDVGSNSIRLCLYQTGEAGVRCLLNQRVMAALASFVRDGVLSEEGIRRASETVDAFCRLARSLGAEKLGVFATASLRNVKNGGEAAARIAAETGAGVRILSGEEEARLGFLGAMGEIPFQTGILADVGGGSTELTLFEEGKVKKLISVPLGSLSLSAGTVLGLSPSGSEIKRMEAAALEAFSPAARALGVSGLPAAGVGGSMRMALDLVKALLDRERKAPVFTPGEVETVLEIAADENPARAKQAYRVCPERMFTLVSGLVILKTIAGLFAPPSFYITTTGVREGYLKEVLLKAQKEKSPAPEGKAE